MDQIDLKRLDVNLRKIKDSWTLFLGMGWVYIENL